MNISRSVHCCSQTSDWGKESLDRGTTRGCFLPHCDHISTSISIISTETEGGELHA
jgi:hypothetical protein